MTFGEKVIAFYRDLDYSGYLPDGIEVMNPFKNNPKVENITREFYTRYFSDYNRRHIILGINPGRFGAGATGIPFTDTLRLQEKCGIAFTGFRTYEPSSAFIYEMIDASGGVHDFYGKFLISAICPLGFTRMNEKGKAVNYNYYDNKALTGAVYGFILKSLRQQLEFGIDTDVAYCLGTGRNEAFLRTLNDRHRFFKGIIALEHPRYIMQYKARFKNTYINKYLEAFKTI
jgi:hypothetical protein